MAGGFIKVDRQLRTSVPGIWAAGDVTGPPLIAPAGAREAQIAVKNMLDPSGNHSIDHRFSPMAVFVDPEFATVGLTKIQAEAQGYAVVTTYVDLERVPKAHVMGEMLGGVLLTAEQGIGQNSRCADALPARRGYHPRGDPGDPFRTVGGRFKYNRSRLSEHQRWPASGSA
jgi:mercuric reductase